VSCDGAGGSGPVASSQAYAWDTHNDNFNIVRRLSEMLNAAGATLMQDLRERDLRICGRSMVGWQTSFRMPLETVNQTRLDAE
jgi:Protein of unknown function (DUF1501)